MAPCLSNETQRFFANYVANPLSIHPRKCSLYPAGQHIKEFKGQMSNRI